MFEGCTVRKHKFWKRQAAPRTHQEQSKMLSKPSLGSRGDDQKWTPKLEHLKIVFCARDYLGGASFRALDPGNVTTIIYIYIYI